MPSFPWLPVPLIQFKLQLWVVLTNPLISLLPINHLTTAPAEHSRALSPNHLLSLNTRVATSFLVSILTLTSLHYFLRNNSVHYGLSVPSRLVNFSVARDFVLLSIVLWIHLALTNRYILTECSCCHSEFCFLFFLLLPIHTLPIPASLQWPSIICQAKL